MYTTSFKIGHLIKMFSNLDSSNMVWITKYDYDNEAVLAELQTLRWI